MTFVALTFGGQNVAFQAVISKGSPIDPVLLAALRDGTALPILLVATLVFGQRCKKCAWWPRGRRDWLSVLACGVVGLYGNQITYVVGLSLTNADLVSFYQPLTPVVTCFLAVLMGLEKLSLFRATGVLLGVAGIIAMVVGKSPGAAPILGHVCLVANALCNSIFVLALKDLYKREGKPDNMAIITWSYALAAACMALTLPIYNAASSPAFAAANTSLLSGLTGPGTWKNWLVVLYAGVIGSALNYSLMTYANRHISATSTAIFGALQPGCTVLLAAVFLDESVRLEDALGGWTIVVAIYILALAEQHEARRQRQLEKKDKLEQQWKQEEGEYRTTAAAEESLLPSSSSPSVTSLATATGDALIGSVTSYTDGGNHGGGVGVGGGGGGGGATAAGGDYDYDYSDYSGADVAGGGMGGGGGGGRAVRGDTDHSINDFISRSAGDVRAIIQRGDAATAAGSFSGQPTPSL